MYEKEQKGCWNEEKVVGGSCCCLQLPNGRGQRSQSQALFKGAQWEFKKQQTQIGTNEIVIIYNWVKKKNNTRCVIKHWHKLPRVAVASPSSKILKTWLEKDLSRSSWAADWTRCSSQSLLMSVINLIKLTVAFMGSFGGLDGNLWDSVFSEIGFGRIAKWLN